MGGLGGSVKVVIGCVMRGCVMSEKCIMKALLT